jgi:HK97 family phage portal protein
MKILGFDVTHTPDSDGPQYLHRLAPVQKRAPVVVTGQSVSSRNGGITGGWWPIVREPSPGAWQRNQETSVQDTLTFPPAWACITLISSDISKLWLGLLEKKNGIWIDLAGDSPFKPVLRKPNRYQTRLKFIECWILSKLTRGNTYVLKQRDARGIVIAMYILDASRVEPLVAPDGAVYYKLTKDNLTGMAGSVTVPASEIIHDLMVPLYHPLVGVSPIHACGMAALQGLKIQENSEQFFANRSQPGGILTAPGLISDATAKRVEEDWEGNYTGVNAGRVAVLGDGLHYEPMTISAHDAQLIEQLKWTGEITCACYHVPPWKIGLAPMPPYGNVQAANIEYYNQALQQLIESLEICLDEGLELPHTADRELGVELDLNALLRMDSLTQMDLATKGVLGAIFTPNEGRELFSKPPVPGGDACFLQQQNFSLEALNKRDQQADPFASGTKPVPPTAVTKADDEDDHDDDEDDEDGVGAALDRMEVSLELLQEASL